MGYNTKRKAKKEQLKEVVVEAPEEILQEVSEPEEPEAFWDEDDLDEEEDKED